jgi:hypothetical protein
MIATIATRIMPSLARLYAAIAASRWPAALKARWVEAFCDLAPKWKPTSWAEEQGQIRASIGPLLETRQGERKAYVYREQFPTRGDKARRAQSIRGRMALQGDAHPCGGLEFAPRVPKSR